MDSPRTVSKSNFIFKDLSCTRFFVLNARERLCWANNLLDLSRKLLNSSIDRVGPEPELYHSRFSSILAMTQKNATILSVTGIDSRQSIVLHKICGVTKFFITKKVFTDTLKRSRQSGVENRRALAVHLDQDLSFRF